MRRTAVVLALVLLSACSSSKDKATTDAEPGTTSGPTSAAPQASRAQPGASASTAASARPGAAATATTSAGPDSGGYGSTTGTNPSSAPRSSAAKGTPPGTYTYDSSGTSTTSPGGKQDVAKSSTLEVTEVVDGSQSSTLHNSQGDTTQSLVVRDNGSYLDALTVKGPGINTEFDFDPPALLLGVPARAGATWSWSGTSTDGKTTVKASNKVARAETVTIGGQKVPTVVLQTHLVITGQDFSYTADTTNWVATALRLPVKTHTVGNGKYGFIAFSFDVTDVLRSTRPA